MKTWCKSYDFRAQKGRGTILPRQHYAMMLILQLLVAVEPVPI